MGRSLPLMLLAVVLAPTVARAAITLNLDVRGTAVRTTIATVAAVTHARDVREIAAGRIEVRDTFSNPTDAIAGLHVAHQISDGASAATLGGRSDPDLSDLYTPWNPTLFVPTSPTTGLGLVAVDDVFRNQLRVTRDATTSALRTDLLCLGPHATYTMTWQAYTTTSADYWDFLNALRRDRGANGTTIPGAMIWFRPDEVLQRTPAGLRDALAAQNVAVASLSGGWVDPQRHDQPPRIGFGTHVLDEPFASYRERIRTAIERLHAARPGLRVLIYFDHQRDSAPDAADRFTDSLLRSEQGRPERSDFGRRFSLSWSMVPTVGNRFGQSLPAVVHGMRALGADGLYWDEMDAVEYSAPRLTSTAWDGHTCRLQDDGRVAAKLGLANLLSDPLKARLAAGTFVLGNSPPTTERFERRNDLRMIEGQHNNVWGAFAHLTTPLGYLGSWLDWPRIRAKIDEGLLVAGGRLDHPLPFIARLFPFTPEDIRPGVLRGRERLITTRSGTYALPPGTKDPSLYRYDSRGTEHAAAWTIERRDGAVAVRVELGMDEAAVIEHDPAGR